MSGDPDEVEELRERVELADRIATAFADAELPRAPISEGDGPLSQDVEAALAGKRAADVTPADAREVRFDLGYLRPEALMYYLPALIRIVLLHDDDVDGLGQALFGMLTPPEQDAEGRFERRMGLLDVPRRNALGDFVGWYSDGESYLPGRARALAYWREAGS